MGNSELSFEAGYYAAIWGGIHRHDYAPDLADALISEYGRVPLLDIGTGCGYLVRCLRERGVEAWGLECSNYAVANRCSEYVVPGDVRDMPFKDGMFNVVHSQGLWEYLPEQEVPSAVTECHRVGKTQVHNVDSSETDWLPEYQYVTWKPREWWDEQLKGPQILIACANYEGKEYAMQRWLDAADALDWPHKRLLMVDNSDTPEFCDRWKDRVPMVHLELQHEPVNRRIALSMEYVRQEFLASKALWWLNLEADVIPPPETIKTLLKHGAGCDWISHNYPDRTMQSQTMSGFGCSLFSRRLCENSFADAPADITTDAFFWHTKIKGRGYPALELWDLLPIAHLNN